MDFFLGILLGVGVIALAIFSRSITTFIHELGHAIPALLFTEEDVVMIVGSYGDLENSFGWRIGRLQIFVKLNIMVWYEGLCMYKPAKGFAKSFLITAGGPLMSLIFSVGLFVWVLQGGRSAGVVTIAGIFILSAFWDFCVNIYPRSKATPLNDGTVTFNDGYSLLQLIRSQGESSAFQEAMVLLRDKDIRGAVETLENYLIKTPSRHGAEQLVNILFDNDRVDEGIEAFERFIKPLPRKQRDYLLLARLYKAENNNSSALDCINKYLHLEFNDTFARNLRGEIYWELNETEKAFDDFKAVIQMNSRDYLAANNFGYLLTKKGRASEAQQFIEPGLPYLTHSARAQFQAGVYFKDSNQHERALHCFLKAKEMGFEHYGLEHFILEVEN